jgi:hypothetical protein
LRRCLLLTLRGEDAVLVAPVHPLQQLLQANLQPRAWLGLSLQRWAVRACARFVVALSCAKLTVREQIFASSCCRDCQPCFLVLLLLLQLLVDRARDSDA